MAAFARWAASERASSAAAGRTRERFLRERAEATATWAGLLVDLAERRATVSVAAGSRRVTGRVAGVGLDFCVLEPTGAGAAVVPFAGMSSVRSEGASSPVSTCAGSSPAGDRRGALELSFAAALATLADERALVALGSGDGDTLAGELVSVGEDVVTLRGPEPTRRLVYARLSSVRIVELR